MIKYVLCSFWWHVFAFQNTFFQQIPNFPYVLLAHAASHMVPLLRRTRTIATCVSKFLAKISYHWWISSAQVWFSTENNMKLQSRIFGKRQNHSKPPIPGSCPAIQVAVAGKPVSWSNSRAGTASFGVHFGPNFSVAKMFYFDLLCIFCWVPRFMELHVRMIFCPFPHWWSQLARIFLRDSYESTASQVSSLHRQWCMTTQ